MLSGGNKGKLTSLNPFGSINCLYVPPAILHVTSSTGGEGNGTPLQYSCLENPMDGGVWKAAVHGVAESRTRLSDFTFTFHFHASEKEMATHSSVLAWRIPGTVEPDGLPSMGSHRVGQDWSDLAAAVLLDSLMQEASEGISLTNSNSALLTLRYHHGINLKYDALEICS